MEPAICIKADDINPDEGDLLLSETGDFVFHTVLGNEVAQRLRVRFEFWRGEWFLDLDAGTPFFEHILKKGPSDAIIRSIFSQVILGTEGVDALTKFAYSVSRTREMTVTFEARLKDATTFRSRDYAPFVVAV
jgi:hypothetical protein